MLLGPVLLAVGDKFELDATRWRYRDGCHWAHRLNPPWQRLPPVQGVGMKPHAYRPLHRGRYSGSVGSGPLWEGYTVLLSVPHSRRGVVVASLTSEAEAEAMAAQVAEALEVPWRRA